MLTINRIKRRDKIISTVLPSKTTKQYINRDTNYAIFEEFFVFDEPSFVNVNIGSDLVKHPVIGGFYREIQRIYSNTFDTVSIGKEEVNTLMLHIIKLVILLSYRLKAIAEVTSNNLTTVGGLWAIEDFIRINAMKVVSVGGNDTTNREMLNVINELQKRYSDLYTYLLELGNGARLLAVSYPILINEEKKDVIADSQDNVVNVVPKRADKDDSIDLEFQKVQISGVYNLPTFVSYELRIIIEILLSPIREVISKSFKGSINNEDVFKLGLSSLIAAMVAYLISVIDDNVIRFATYNYKQILTNIDISEEDYFNTKRWIHWVAITLIRDTLIKSLSSIKCCGIDSMRIDQMDWEVDPCDLSIYDLLLVIMFNIDRDIRDLTGKDVDIYSTFQSFTDSLSRSADKFQKGGIVDRINSASGTTTYQSPDYNGKLPADEGMLLDFGKTHNKGGIKAIIKGVNHKQNDIHKKEWSIKDYLIELEQGEAIINFCSTYKHCDALSKINSEYGVEFDCEDFRTLFSDRYREECN